MEDVSIVGVDLAKQVFEVHGGIADHWILFREKHLYGDSFTGSATSAFLKRRLNSG